jgi:hypothetical protein
MPQYRFYLLNAARRIVGRIDQECETDEAAVALAQDMAAEHVELWQLDRKLGLVTPGERDPASAAPP